MVYYLAVLAEALRTVLLLVGLLVVVIATADWAVRTRRLNPFNGISRFMRARVEPRMAGIERLVVRSGGHASTTPWWAVVAYVVFALAVLGIVDLVISLVRDMVLATSAGAMGIIALFIHWVFGFLILALLVRVISSWIPPLAHSRWTTWSLGATEWMLRPLRRVLPALGPVDISPIVAYFGLQIAQWLVERVLLGGR